jgi:uncharacterized protein (DUF488 family)
VRRTFTRLLTTERGVEQLSELQERAATQVVALLCFESDERLCHRQQVLAALS